MGTPGLVAPQFPIMKTLTAEYLEQETRRGWRVVQVIEVETYRAVTEANPTPMPSNPSYHSWQPNIQRNVLEKTVMFLVGLDEQSSLALLQKVITEAHTQRDEETNAKHKAQQECKEACKAKEEAGAVMKKAEQNFENEARRVAALHQQLSSVKSDAERMKTDLNKIRQALGDLRVKEILGGA